MWCYTVDRGVIREGLRVRTEGTVGVHIGGSVIPVEEKIAQHLLSAESALMKRIEGDYNPLPIIGEDRGRPELTRDDATDVMEEVLVGWYVNHLTFDPEAKSLMHATPYARERRCLLSIVNDGVVEYLSNVPREERLERGRVIRAFHPLNQAAGVKLLASEGRRRKLSSDQEPTAETAPDVVLEEVSEGLLMLEAGASFRIHRETTNNTWREALVSWNGRTVAFRAFGNRAPTRKRAA